MFIQSKNLASMRDRRVHPHREDLRLLKEASPRGGQHYWHLSRIFSFFQRPISHLLPYEKLGRLHWRHLPRLRWLSHTELGKRGVGKIIQTKHLLGRPKIHLRKTELKRNIICFELELEKLADLIIIESRIQL